MTSRVLSLAVTNVRGGVDPADEEAAPEAAEPPQANAAGADAAPPAAAEDSPGETLGAAVVKNGKDRSWEITMTERPKGLPSKCERGSNEP